MTKKDFDCSNSNALDDAIFHYTNADGLYGILTNKEIWSTAYFTSSDASELSAAEGILANLFQECTEQLVREKHESVKLLLKRGADISKYPRLFESIWLDSMKDNLHIFVTSFSSAKTIDVFQDGLLSQWRGYGRNGGYALQFSRTKLTNWIQLAYQNKKNCRCELLDVHYGLNNPYRVQVLDHKASYLEAYMNYLNCLAELAENSLNADKLIRIESEFTFPESMMELIESLFFYRLQTKNRHFSEEMECRMSVILAEPLDEIEFFNRAGVLVPYIKTPKSSKSILECLDGVIVGPGPHQEVRSQSVGYLLMSLGLEKEVRLSKIPYTGS